MVRKESYVLVLKPNRRIANHRKQGAGFRSRCPALTIKVVSLMAQVLVPTVQVLAPSALA